MNDKLLEMHSELSDLEIQLDEAKESGDLEEQMDLAFQIEDKKSEIFRQSMIETGGL